MIDTTGPYRRALAGLAALAFILLALVLSASASGETVQCHATRRIDQRPPTRFVRPNSAYARGVRHGEIAGWHAGRRDAFDRRPCCDTPRATARFSLKRRSRAYREGYSRAFPRAYRNAYNQYAFCGMPRERGHLHRGKAGPRAHARPDIRDRRAPRHDGKRRRHGCRRPLNAGAAAQLRSEAAWTPPVIRAVFRAKPAYG
jgi:hypothetical protein